MRLIPTYVGGSFDDRLRIKEMVEGLEYFKHKVLGTWFDKENPIEKLWDNNFNGKVAFLMAQVDTYAIMTADVIVIDTITKSSTGGSDVEFGLALARISQNSRVRLVLIGPARHIFHSLAPEHYQTWGEFFDQLTSEELIHDVE